jgi:hypothetical protein
MPISGEEARERALQKTEELRKLSRELCAIIDELPVPSPEEFEAIRDLRAPWTPEAYYAALIRNVDFHVDQARVLIDDYADKTEESLNAFFRGGFPPHSPDIERSLRYVVEERFEIEIPPSARESDFHDPLAWTKIMMVTLLRSVTTASAPRRQQEIDEDERRTVRKYPKPS